jgi:hypothetical protein
VKKIATRWKEEGSRERGACAPSITQGKGKKRTSLGLLSRLRVKIRMYKICRKFRSHFVFCCREAYVII